MSVSRDSTLLSVTSWIDGDCDMVIYLAICLLLWDTVQFCRSEGISSKTLFDEDGLSFVAYNSSQADGEDVELKQTIVVSTKLKNNGGKGINGRSNGDAGVLSYNIGSRSKKDETPDVPVYIGRKAVETTQIRTSDTRRKAHIYPESVFINRNIRDEYDTVYPNVATNPSQWKPSNFYNNINWYDAQRATSYRNNGRNDNRNEVKIQRKMSDDGMKEFYCRRCRELNTNAISHGPRGCNQQNTMWQETTTPKVKIDGKLAKLN